MTGQFSTRLNWSGYLLGFGLGGFFDGILLHQILQWHHLLSLVEGVGDVRRQVFFDGLFHALMYVIAAIGLGFLWGSRRELALKGAGRHLFGNVLIGFGVWHIADSVLSHWVLGIHRIKLDSPNPLMWDLIWFAAFALTPLVIGLLLRRRGAGNGAMPMGGKSAALGIALAAFVGGAWAAQSPADARTAMVVFRPGVSDGQAFNAIQKAGGNLLWQSRGVWAVSWEHQARSAPLYRNGALLVSSSFLGAGCLAWSQV
jgi:uncharacterized membrane protein